MPQWGRNDQAVTANTITTFQTSNGAPIGTYSLVKGGKTGTAANVAHTSNSAFGNTSPGTCANVDVVMFNNLTAGALVAGQAVGVFGISPTEQAASKLSADHPAHAGWNIRRAGTGGRAGRVHYECLVAMGSLGVTNPAAGTPALVADSAGDVSKFPGA